MNRKKSVVFYLFILGIFTATIIFFNRLIHSISTKNNLLSTGEGLFYRWRFGSVFYTKKGQGSPVLLVHDLASFSSGYEWHLLESQLAKTNTVYTLDLLGCGRSDKPAITYTSFLYTQILSDFLEDIIGEPTQIIGTGSSSSFIIDCCNYDNTYIDKVLLINPKSPWALANPSSKGNRSLRKLLTMPILGTFLYNLIANKCTLAYLLKNVYFHDPYKITDLILDTYVETSQKSKANGKFLYACMVSKLTHSNVFHSLARINTPLHVVSSLGISSTLEIALEYQDLIPSATITTLEGSNYLPQLETPEELLEQIKIILDY